MDDVRAAHQTITFCSVSAHHQNGIAERRIRDITENARTSLLHAAHRWPKAIAANLWPQAIKHVVNVRNSLPRPGNRVAVLQIRWDICSAQLETLSPVWVPCVRHPVTLANEKHISKVGRTLKNWHPLMPFTTSCVLRPTHPVNPNRARQPTIPLCL